MDQHFDALFGLVENPPPTFEDYIQENVCLEELSKGHEIIKPCIDGSIYYIKKGVVAIAAIFPDQEQLICFKQECDFVLNARTDTYGHPKAGLKIIAVEDCEFWVLKPETTDYLFRNHREFILYFSKLLEYELEDIRDFEYVRSKNSVEAWLNYLGKPIFLLYRVPLNYLAMYTGASEETISKMLKKN